jgi:hypothetical protein
LDWRQRLFRQPAKQVRDGRHGGKKGLAPKVVSAARGAGLGRLPQVAERGSLQRPFRRLARQVLRCCLLGGFRNTPGRLLRQQARHARKAVRMGLWSSSVEEVGSVHQGTRRARRCPLLVAAASTRNTEKPSERVSARTGRRPAERQGKPQPATATPRGCHRRRQNRQLRGGNAGGKSARDVDGPRMRGEHHFGGALRGKASAAPVTRTQNTTQARRTIRWPCNLSRRLDERSRFGGRETPDDKSGIARVLHQTAACCQAAHRG